MAALYAYMGSTFIADWALVCRHLLPWLRLPARDTLIAMLVVVYNKELIW